MFVQGDRRRAARALGYLPVVLTCLVIAALAAWRLACVRLGPDPDTDAYGHYVIARQLLETPHNLKIHWVWLPVYHCLLGLGVQLGATLDHVRSTNAVIAGVIPLLLLWLLHRTTRARAHLRDAALPYLAALLCAATPLVMQIGTTGQMELLFALLLLGAAALLQNQRYGLAAALLCIAALTRYEAWAAVLAVAAVLAQRRLTQQRKAIGARAALCIAGPAVCVLGWAALRWLGGEPWFGFIRDNQAFAEAALDPGVAAGNGLVPALGRYVFTVPLRVMGLAALFAAFGWARALRTEGVWFVALPLGVLAFLTASSLTRSQLGLDRHFLAVVPFAATWAAHGVARSAEWLTAVYERTVRAPPMTPALENAPAQPGQSVAGARFAGVSFVLVGLVVVTSALTRLGDWMGAWQGTTQTALLDSRAAGSFLAATPRCSVIVCDDAAVEVLSGLDGSRFIRSRVEPRVVPEVLALAQSRDVYVISRAAQMSAVMNLGTVAYGGSNGASDRLVAIHIPRDGRMPLNRFGRAAGSESTRNGMPSDACPSEGGG